MCTLAAVLQVAFTIEITSALPVSSLLSAASSAHMSSVAGYQVESWEPLAHVPQPSPVELPQPEPEPEPVPDPAVVVVQAVIQAELSVATAIQPTAFKDTMAAQLSLAASSSGGTAIHAEDIIITAFEITSAATADPIGCANTTFTTGIRNQFANGTKAATGATTVTVSGTPVCVAQRRRLQVRISLAPDSRAIR